MITLDVHDYSGKLLYGFYSIATCTFRKPEMLASWSKTAINWLTDYTFRVEKGWPTQLIASAIADVFYVSLYSHGNDSAIGLFSRVHKGATDALFQPPSNTICTHWRQG